MRGGSLETCFIANKEHKRFALALLPFITHPFAASRKSFGCSLTRRRAWRTCTLKMCEHGLCVIGSDVAAVVQTLHCDLALRNLLLDHGGVVRIADFGLATLGKGGAATSAEKPIAWTGEFEGSCSLLLIVAAVDLFSP